MLAYEHVVGLELVAMLRAVGQGPAGPRTVEPGHEVVELISSGRASINIDGRWELVGVGCLLWHLPGEATSCRLFGGDPYECLVVDFAIEQAVPRQVPRCSVFGDAAAVDRFRHELLTDYHRDGYDSFALCRRVHAELQWRAHVSGLSRSDPFGHRAINAVVEHIEQHFMESLNVESLAELAGISDKYLHELFAEHLETSPYRYLTERRITEARHLLTATDRTVKDIAAACGFPDPGNFGRTFKHALGLSPSQYRQRHSLAAD